MPRVKRGASLPGNAPRAQRPPGICARLCGQRVGRLSNTQIQHRAACKRETRHTNTPRKAPSPRRALRRAQRCAGRGSISRARAHPKGITKNGGGAGHPTPHPHGCRSSRPAGKPRPPAPGVQRLRTLHEDNHRHAKSTPRTHRRTRAAEARSTHAHHGRPHGRAGTRRGGALAERVAGRQTQSAVARPARLTQAPAPRPQPAAQTPATCAGISTRSSRARCVHGKRVWSNERKARRNFACTSNNQPGAPPRPRSAAVGRAPPRHRGTEHLLALFQSLRAR